MGGHLHPTYIEVFHKDKVLLLNHSYYFFLYLRSRSVSLNDKRCLNDRFFVLEIKDIMITEHRPLVKVC